MAIMSRLPTKKRQIAAAAAAATKQNTFNQSK
jgi:hypothetical protein